jgi:homoserine dehydrogenase (EC 1.1.1.3)
MKKVKVGFLGLGTVGSGVYKVLEKNADMIRTREGLDIEVSRVLVRDRNKRRAVDIDSSLLTTDAHDIINDPGIDIIAEFMGGEEPAFTYLSEALKKGKTVVTANKEVIAKHWDVLEQEAAETGAGLYFEASVAGGIPIIKTIKRSLQANHILKFMGIINGTTNYILTRMSEEGLDFQTALKEAQRLGYAEPDPTADIEGLDAKFKLSILSTICFRDKVPLEHVFCEGITKVTSEDIEYARQLGYGIKLLAIAKKNGNRIEARVHPTFIPLTHPLCAVRESYNAIFLEGDVVGNLMFYGRGAGDMPTASAVVSDIITAGQNLDGYHHRTGMDGDDVVFEQNWVSKYYVRMLVCDRPGVLGVIAGLFGKNGVSLESVIQKNRGQDANLIFITHEAHEQSMMKALEEMKNCPVISSIESMIRVEH